MKIPFQENFFWFLPAVFKLIFIIFMISQSSSYCFNYVVFLNSEDFNSECERLAFNFGFVIETLRPLLIDSSDQALRGVAYDKKYEE